MDLSVIIKLCFPHWTRSWRACANQYCFSKKSGVNEPSDKGSMCKLPPSLRGIHRRNDGFKCGNDSAGGTLWLQEGPSQSCKVSMMRYHIDLAALDSWDERFLSSTQLSGLCFVTDTRASFRARQGQTSQAFDDDEMTERITSSCKQTSTSRTRLCWNMHAIIVS